MSLLIFVTYWTQLQPFYCLSWQILTPMLVLGKFHFIDYSPHCGSCFPSWNLGNHLGNLWVSYLVNFTFLSAGYLLYSYKYSWASFQDIVKLLGNSWMLSGSSVFTCSLGPVWVQRRVTFSSPLRQGLCEYPSDYLWMVSFLSLGDRRKRSSWRFISSQLVRDDCSPWLRVVSLCRVRSFSAEYSSGSSADLWASVSEQGHPLRYSVRWTPVSLSSQLWLLPASPSPSHGLRTLSRQ